VKPGRPLGPGQTPAEIELFLSQHNLEPDAEIEQIEISNNGAFECYMFLVSRRDSDGLALLAMRPEYSLPFDAGAPSHSG
jgi:hypothetical protein